MRDGTATACNSSNYSIALLLSPDITCNFPFCSRGVLHMDGVLNAGARIKRVECDEGGGQFKAPFKKYRVILDKDGGGRVD